MQTRIVNRRKERGDVYVGRPGPYGNPIELNKSCPLCRTVHRRDAGAIECSAKALLERLADPGYQVQVAALNGLVLECWCSPLWCHAELLVAYTEAYSERIANCRVNGATADPAVLAHQDGVEAVGRAARRAIDALTRATSQLSLPL
jgi:hypothetical protein